MGSCFGIAILVLAFIFVMASLLRWFEQTADAVDDRDWNKVSILIALPFMVWRYESKVTAGRPTPVPHHEPAKGFGGLPKGGIVGPPADAPANAAMASAAPPKLVERPIDAPPKTIFPPGGPPPGTPAEFLGMPVIPPKKPRTKPTLDPDKLAKLRQKMIDQGMIKPPDENKEI